MSQSTFLPTTKPLRDLDDHEYARLMGLIDASAGPEKCWIFRKSCRNTRGYGQIKLDGVNHIAHRLLLHRQTPCPYVGACALHSCDTAECCNPAHLRWGTLSDNAKDRESRNRGNQPTAERHWSKLRPDGVLKREQHPRSKLNWEKVKLIREIYVPNKVSYSEIARKFEVSVSTVIRAANHVNWKTT
jgi:hypothetical protein